MYSVVLLMAMTGGGDVPAGLFGGHGCCGGKHGGGSCYGGSCYGSGYGGCYGSGYGCCGGGKHHGGRGHGCCGGGGHGLFGGRGHGCCGGKHHGGGHGCCGGGYAYGCYGSGYSCMGSGYGCTGSMGYGAGCYGSGMGYGCTGSWGGAGYGCTGSWGGAGYGCTGAWGGAGCYGAGAGAGCVGGAPAMGAPVIGTPVNPGTTTTPEKIKAKPMTAVPAPATIVVSLPAEAKLLIDDAATASKSAQRVFVSPTLNPGRDYHYTLKAEWMRDGKAVSMTREIAVRAGQETRVQFAAEQPASVASR